MILLVFCLPWLYLGAMLIYGVLRQRRMSPGERARQRKLADFAMEGTRDSEWARILSRGA